MIDRFGGEIEDYVPDMAFTAIDYSQVDPSKYKDMFEVPKTFQDAWNHPEHFQRSKWRQGIRDEFAKMNKRGVWRKIKQMD